MCWRPARRSFRGDDAFRLYDTFGFPVDPTREIVAEQQLTIDEDTFRKLMQAQRERARSARANISGWSNASKTLLAGMPKTEFVGYTATECDAKVVALLVDDMAVEEVTEGDFTLVLDRTPFYGESGGQVGDTGTVTGHDFAASVTDTQKSDGVYIHLCSLARGSVRVGDSIHAEVSDAAHRHHAKPLGVPPPAGGAPHRAGQARRAGGLLRGRGAGALRLHAFRTADSRTAQGS